MTDRPPEGPKADYGPGEAKPTPIPRPPAPEAVDQISEDQSLITDEWTGEPDEKDAAGVEKKG